MGERTIPGRIVVAASPVQVAEQSAARLSLVLREAASKGGAATMALSGGNSPRQAYARLAREPGVDWDKVRVFWVDERAVPPTDDRSNYRWAKAELLDHAPIPATHVHRMAAERSDRAAAAIEYEKLIREHVRADGDGVPSFDAVVLGVGDDGHTASLFPGDTAVDITDRLVLAVPAQAAREARLTLTAPAIIHARHVFVIAIGAGKRPALERVWKRDGDVHVTPARIIRECRGSVTWIVDEAADGVN